MRRACCRCRCLPVVVVVLAAALATALWSAMSMVALLPAAQAASEGLTVVADRPLSLVEEAVTLTVRAQLPASLEGDKLVIRVKGPAEPSQIGQSAPELPEADKIVVDLGKPSPAAWLGSVDDLREGILEAQVGLPGGHPGSPGAYLLVAEVEAAGQVMACGQTWVGKAVARGTPLDLAFVLPASLGIHRDADGRFYDQALEQAVSASDGKGDLRGLLALSGRFPDWRFTLAVEPVLLTQLRDMADGYVRVDSSGATTDVAADAPSSRDAAEVLQAFKDLAADGAGAVGMIAGPYSGADLGVLAAEGWHDGLQQMQMAKQEMQQTLSLPTPPAGGYAPGLVLTAESLSCYAEASIDHVVVSESVKASLAEAGPPGADAVRAQNVANDRVTLVFADSALAARLGPPWDPGVFAAALAAELASEYEEALVVAPSSDFGLVPASFLESIGEILQGLDWVRTQTVAELLREHAPDTRPVLLMATAAARQGYIGESLLAGLRAAHKVTSDLASVADPTRGPVAEALGLLYMAESRWWWRPGTSPQEATIGMEYAEKARRLAEDEMSKVHFLSSTDSVSIVGEEGTIRVVVQNDTGYPLTVQLDLQGTGVALPEGQLVEVELAGGRNEIPVRIAETGEASELRAALRAGTSIIDEAAYPLHFVSIRTILPWAVVAGLVIAVGVIVIVRRSRHKHRTAA